MRSAWQEYRLKHLVRVVVDKATNTNEGGTYVGLEAISSWTGQIDTQQNATTDQSLGNRFTLGDVLFGKLRPYLAKVAAPDFCGHCSGEALVLRPNSRISTRFLQYRMIEVGAIDAVNASTYGAKMPRASWEFIGNLRFHVPDLETQKTIADFLDREIARIDQLIEKKQQLVALLKECRSAMISETIIGNALNNTAWLTNLPEGWKAEKAKFHYRESQKRSETGEEELLTVSHITGVTKRSEKDVNMFMAESNKGYKLVVPGDVIINTMWAWMGAMGVSSEFGLISPSYGVYALNSNELRFDFVDLMVRSKPFVAEATRRSKGVHSSRLRLYPDAFLDMRLPIPPIETQDALLQEISERTQREDKLIWKNERAEALLRELRAALITAAVTGQLNVTTWRKQGSTDRHLATIQEEIST